ncbi:MAG: Crp/Fnr family transcriptional regulator [Phocaeicola sp.]
MVTTTPVDIARKLSMQIFPLSKEGIYALAEIVVRKKCKKGEILLEEGEICTSLMFVEKGLFRQYYYKNEKDLTEHISYEGGMIICIESIFMQKPSKLIVEALEGGYVWFIPRDKLDLLIEKHADLNRMYRQILENSLIESQVKADAMRFESAHERYKKLQQRHPEILKRTPLIYIASLLQMTPETLSRVRANLL